MLLDFDQFLKVGLSLKDQLPVPVPEPSRKASLTRKTGFTGICVERPSL